MAGSHTGCGCMTSRTGCLIIGWLEVIFIIPLLVGGVVVMTMGFLTDCPVTEAECIETVFGQNVDRRQTLILIGTATLALCGLYLFAPCCLIHGTSNEKPTFVMPYIICAVLKNITSLVLVIAMFFAEPGVAILMSIFFGIEIYKTVVVWCHYNYLTGKPKSDNEMLVNKGAYVNF